MKEIRQQRINTLYKERDNVVDSSREAASSFDKNMLTLSAGALALSITFIKVIPPLANNFPYLVTSWVFFSLSLLSTLVSFLTCINACQKAISNLDYEINPEQSRANCYLLPHINTLWKKLVSFF